MSCKHYQRLILEALAAGATVLPDDVILHQPHCPACLAFFQEQSDLFRSLHSGLEMMVNKPAPASLISGLRARLEEQPAPRHSFLSGWKLAALGATILVAISFGLLWRGKAYRNSTTAIIPQTVVSIPPVVEQTSPQPRVAARLVHKIRNGAPMREESEQAELEVIVLPEESEAFARFVARVLDEPQLALALTRPAPRGDESPVEIALLKIDDLEVKPLEAMK
jgi:hypothetical protein